MKNDYCHVTFVLDRSGSMSGCWQETIESVRQFLRTQKELPGKMTFSLYTFNTGINRVCDFLDIQGLDVNGLSVDAPIGWTSLWDAAQYSINETGEKLAKLPEYERPSKVLMVYLTDGEENSSKYANVTKIRGYGRTSKDDI